MGARAETRAKSKTTRMPRCTVRFFFSVLVMFVSAVYFVVLHPSGVGVVCKHDDYYHEVEIIHIQNYWR